MNACLKCQGLVVAESVRDEVAGASCVMGRCVNCGHLADAVVAARCGVAAPSMVGHWSVLAHRVHQVPQALQGR